MALGSQIGFLSLTFCVQPIEWDSLWGNLSVFMSQITLLGGESLIVSSKSTQEGIFLSIAVEAAAVGQPSLGSCSTAKLLCFFSSWSLILLCSSRPLDRAVPQLLLLLTL